MTRYIQNVYWVLPVLESLANFSNFRVFLKKYHKKCVGTYARGYAFLVASTIIKLIEELMLTPQVLGLARNEVLERASFIGLPFYRIPHKTRTGRFVRNLAELYRPLLGINNWKMLKSEMAEIVKYLVIPLRESFENAVEVYKGSKDRLLLETSMFFTYIYFHDLKHVKIAYDQAFYQSKIEWAQSVKIPLVIPRNQELFKGYRLAVEYLWYSFLGDQYRTFSSLRMIPRKRNWEQFDRLFEEIRDEIIVPMEERAKIDYMMHTIFRQKESVSKGFHILTDSLLFKPSRKSMEEVLDEAFLWYPIQIVKVPSEALGFVISLLGYSKFKKERIKAIKFIHPQAPGNNYSFAILIESHGLISDFSYWLLYHNFATDYSGAGGSSYRFVMKHLEKMKEKVNLSEVSVDERDLFHYASDTRMRTLEREVKELGHVNDALRGQILELFVSHLISKMGYASYWRYRNRSILGRREIDIIAVRERDRRTEMLIIETFGSFPKDLDKITKELTEKLSKIKSNWPEILNDLQETRLDSSEPHPEIKVWATTFDRTQKKELSPDILVIDRNELRRLCRKYNVRLGQFLLCRYKHKTRSLSRIGW